MQALCSVWGSVSPEAYSWSCHSQWWKRLPVDLPRHYIWWTEAWDMSSCVGSQLYSSTVPQSTTCWWHVSWNFYYRQVRQLKLTICEISLSTQGLLMYALQPPWALFILVLCPCQYRFLCTLYEVQSITNDNIHITSDGGCFVRCSW